MLCMYDGEDSSPSILGVVAVTATVIGVVNDAVSVINGIERAVKGGIDIYNSLTSDNKKNK